MSSAAQQEETAGSYLATGTDGASVLRQVAAERLAAHRSRRAVVEGRAAQAQVAAQAAVRLQARREAAGRAHEEDATSRVRDAVAARYLQSQTYREFLAIEAQRALEQAQAEADVAACSAQAVVAAQRKLLEEIEQWNQPLMDADELAETQVLAVVPPRAKKETRNRVAEPSAPVRLQVRLHEELEIATPAETTLTPARMMAGAAEELADLDDEIEFRRAPEFDDLVLETSPIHGNIIEFPRELVASRKVRPRLAEGPLLEEVAPEPQLRIFEVEPEQIAAEPEVMLGPAAPEWQSLRLGSGTAAQTRDQNASQLDASDYFDHWLEPVVHAAPVSRRLMSTAVDAGVLVCAFAGAAALAVKLAGGELQGMPLPTVATCGAGALVVFAGIYRLLFFTLNEATPGMRLTRLAFCTFDEKSPKRSAVRKRLFATLLATCPLGMGLLWTVLDSDRLGWHDRMSRMYLRSY